MTKFSFISIFYLISLSTVACAEGVDTTTSTNSALGQIVVEYDNVTKSRVRSGVASANLCWLSDSDLKRPNAHKSLEDAINEIGCGSLRFPYGHLSDNYLWHTPPYDDAEEGLRPAVATKEYFPGNWEWAVNPDGSFIDSMDFDEYMDICERNSIEPLVVVNLMSFKLPGGPSLESLAESAAEWVRYAKKRGYEVAYWQLGNEIDHNRKKITLLEFIEAYRAIATAMREVDPTAKIGPGILGTASYFNRLYKECPELISFSSVHQYMWSFKESCKTYELWRDYEGQYISNVVKMQEAVSSVEKDMDIVITETGVSPSGQGMGDINNTYKALWWFEVLMSEISLPNVAYSYFWGTHSPWGGIEDDEDDDVAVLLRVDDNSRKPTADVSMLVNENVAEQFVAATTTAKGLRVYSMRSCDGRDVVLFVMNKMEEPITQTLAINNAPRGIDKLERVELYGEGAHTRKLIRRAGSSVRLNDGRAEVTFAPLSITVLKN